MDISALRSFFLWGALLNYLIITVMFMAFLFVGDRIYSLHQRWFNLDRRTFDGALYLFLGFYKIGTHAFFLVPWLALLIIAN